MKRYLIVVDMQYDFLAGALSTHEAQMIVPAVMMKTICGKYDKVIFTQDCHSEADVDTVESRTFEKHCIDTKNQMILPGLVESAKESGEVISKNTFSADWRRYFNEWTTDEIEICGVCTDICVISNALAIRNLAPRAKIIVDSSACAGTSPEAHEAALKVMKSCCIEVV